MPSFDDVYGSLNVPDPTLYRAAGVSQQDGRVGRYDHETSGSSNDSGSLSFLDIVDVVNPLHHIPGVSTVYRELTGDEISPAARVAGGSLYFGPIGFVGSTINAVVDTVTGYDIGGHVANLFEDEDAPSLAGGGSDDFQLAVGADGELSIDDWLQQPAPGTPEAAAQSTQDPAIVGSLPANSQVATEALARTAPSSVSAPGKGDTLSARPVSPMESTNAAVALEALPADILAALMSGSPVRPVEPIAATAHSAAVNPDAGFGSLGAPLPPSVEQDMTPDHLMRQQDQNPDDPFANLGAIAVQDVTAYSETDTYGQVAPDGGWFTLAMSDALARYDGSAALRLQSQKSFVDVSR